MNFEKIVNLICVSFISFSWSKACPDGKIRGVNLGGWLLLEPWITPELFREVNGDRELIVDEWTFAYYVDADSATEILQTHWDTFITKSDFEILSKAGISHLRIPVGYWAVDVQEGEPFPQPQDESEGILFHLKQAFLWAEELDMKVLVDLHGAPGSQNGFDNSGKRGKIRWLEEQNVERTLRIIEQFCKLLNKWVENDDVKADTIYGIELLNEPWGVQADIWEEIRDRFYPNGYKIVRDSIGDAFTVSIQQGFRPWYNFYDYMSDPDKYTKVALDIHSYHAFGPFWNLVASQDNAWSVNLEAACLYHWELMNVTLNTFVGEWSLAITDCQLYLQGGYNEPYHPGCGKEVCTQYNSDFSTYTDEYKTFLRNFMLAQMDSFEFGDNGIGWFFWTAKTENHCAPEWDLIFLIENQIAPEDFCTRDKYCLF